MTLDELASALGCRVHGNGSIEITGVAAIDRAGPTELTFLANPKYASRVRQAKAAAILVSNPIGDAPMASVVSSNPYLDFARALALFYAPPVPEPGVHPLAFVHDTALVGEGASIGPFAVVGRGVRIGRNAVLHPHVVIYEGAEIGDDFLAHAHASVREHCRIGHRVILQNGVVVGGDGFGFAKRADGSHEKIVQAGIAVVEDDVEVQSLSAVDRATVGETRVKRGAKIDNLVQVGHGVSVGRNVLLAAQVGIAGSTRIEDDAVLGGQVGVGDHLTVGRASMAVGQSGITDSVEPGARVAGYPAIDSRAWGRSAVLFRRLPELKRRIEALEAKLMELERKRS